MISTMTPPTVLPAGVIDTAGSSPEPEPTRRQSSPVTATGGADAVSRREVASELLRVGGSERLRIAVAADKVTAVAGRIVRDLQVAGFDVVYLPPPVPDDEAFTAPVDAWVRAAALVGRAVVDQRADVGVLLCFTGTGVSIAANKIPGVRAALCGDAVTAAGARRWHDANICVLSYRLVTAITAGEILQTFLATTADPDSARALDSLTALEQSR